MGLTSLAKAVLGSLVAVIAYTYFGLLSSHVLTFFVILGLCIALGTYISVQNGSLHSSQQKQTLKHIPYPYTEADTDPFCAFIGQRLGPNAEGGEHAPPQTQNCFGRLEGDLPSEKEIHKLIREKLLHYDRFRRTVVSKAKSGKPLSAPPPSSFR